MDAAKKDRLVKAGIRVDDALERFMGNEALLDRFLTKFLADTNYEALVRAVAGGDHAAALTASHTLKGVCGNLSMEALFSLLTCQVQALRAGDHAAADAMMPDISAAYGAVVRAIRESTGHEA